MALSDHVRGVRCWVLPHKVKAALTLPPARSLLQASGCVRDARGCIGLVAFTWGLGILVSARALHHFSPPRSVEHWVSTWWLGFRHTHTHTHTHFVSLSRWPSVPGPQSPTGRCSSPVGG